MVLQRLLQRFVHRRNSDLPRALADPAGYRARSASFSRAPHLPPPHPQLHLRPSPVSSSSSPARGESSRLGRSQRAPYSSGIPRSPSEGGRARPTWDSRWGTGPPAWADPGARPKDPLPVQSIPGLRGLRGFIMNPPKHKKPPDSTIQGQRKLTPDVGLSPSRTRRPTLTQRRMPRQRPLADTTPSPAIEEERALPPLEAGVDVTERVRALELEPIHSRPTELATSPEPVDPVVALSSTISTLLRLPDEPPQDLFISHATFSRVLELVGSQTSTFAPVELALEAGMAVDEMAQLVKRRERAARLVLRMTEGRQAILSTVDEYWVQRAWLQLSMPDLSLPASSYYFTKDRVLTLQVSFFRALLCETAPPADAADALQHFTTLLPRLSISSSQSTTQPRADVVEVLDLILDRCSLRDDSTLANLVITSLLDLRRPQPDHHAHHGDIPSLLRQILHGTNGSCASPSRSIDMYNHLRDLGLLADLGSAALVQFGLSQSQLWAAAKVLDNPTLSPRHFHLLAYRMLQMSEKIAKDDTLHEGRKFFETSRLARVFRRMGSDAKRPKRPLALDLRNRIVKMLSANGSRTEAAWIYLNYPTWPDADTHKTQRRPITINLDSGEPEEMMLPPVRAGLIPLPKALAQQLFMILLHGRPTHADLLLALAVLETLKPERHHIKFYNLLLRQGFSVFPRRDEADAFASLVHNLLAAHSHIQPNIQTLEAHLHAWPKTSQWRSPNREEREEIASFRAAALDAYFSLVEQQGHEFRRRTWDLLVGAVSRECGGEAGREAIEWMRIKGGFEPDEETWGLWLEGAERVGNGLSGNKAKLAEERVEQLIAEEGIRHNKHTYTTLLYRSLFSQSTGMLNNPEAVRILFLTQLVTRDFPGTSWIQFVLPFDPGATDPDLLPSDVPSTKPPLSMRIYTAASDPSIHVMVANLERALPSSLPSISSLLANRSSPPPTIRDLQPPAQWADWFPGLLPNHTPPRDRRVFEFSKDAAPILRLFMKWFRREGDEEMVKVVEKCLREGRGEERKRREGMGRGRGWWAGGWEWEDEWRGGD